MPSLTDLKGNGLIYHEKFFHINCNNDKTYLNVLTSQRIYGLERQRNLLVDFQESFHLDRNNDKTRPPLLISHRIYELENINQSSL